MINRASLPDHRLSASWGCGSVIRRYPFRSWKDDGFVTERSPYGLRLAYRRLAMECRREGLMLDEPTVPHGDNRPSLTTVEHSFEKDEGQGEQAKVGAERCPDDCTDDQPDVGEQDDRGLPSRHSNRQAA